MTLDELKKQNIQFSTTKNKPTSDEYIVSFSAVYQRPGQKSSILEETICCEVPPQLKAKDLLDAIKKQVLKEKFKDVRLANLKKFIIFNLYKL